MEIEREPATQDRRYTGTQPFDTETRMDTDTGRRKLMNVCINKATTSKKLQLPTIGRGSVTTEQADEQMSMPVRCNAVKGAGRRSCRKHTGVPRSSTSLHKTCTERAMELAKGEQRVKRPESVRQHFVSLRARSLLLPRPPPFIGQEGAVRY